tara:strand:- start:2910 stop:3422 length:513 start_codon:yes stop_codon:yes gene_type:complete
MYAKVESGAIKTYPYGRGHLSADNPNVSFPSDALSRQDVQDSFGVVEVESVARPSKVGHKAVEASPELVNGKWTQKWELVLKDVGEVDDSEVTQTPEPKQDGKIATIGDPIYVWDGDKWTNNWVLEDCNYRTSRLIEYGTPEEQLEHISENGLESWQSNVATIKAKYPKP